MKVVERMIYDRGDLVMITQGYNKGKVGTVIKHHILNNEVDIALDVVGDLTEDDEDNGIHFIETSLKFINKKEYEAALKANNIIRVEGLPVNIQFKNKSFIIGDNVVTPANAKKLADFILEHNKPKKKGK